MFEQPLEDPREHDSSTGPGNPDSQKREGHHPRRTIRRAGSDSHRQPRENETRRSLEEFVRGYLDARGKDNVTQVALERESFEGGTLYITAHTLIQEELPDIVTETHAITHHGHRYDFPFVEDPYGPQDEWRITLYAADSISGMDEVPLEDGLAAADEHIQDLLERDEPLPSPTIN